MYVATGVTELYFVEVYVVLYETDVGLLVVKALIDEILDPLVTDRLLGRTVVDVDVGRSEAIVFAFHFDHTILIY